jgi:medium-chain acyl-[acyl-carrier-protein] hydrolase
VPVCRDKRLVVIRETAAASDLTLICLPYAGGNPELFVPWPEWINEPVGLVAVRLPGHGSRLREKPFENWDDLVDDSFDALSPFLCGPHALYGHCFGGRLAYELAHRATAQHPGQTRRLFVSGCRSPNTAPANLDVHDLPDDEFRVALLRMGVAPAEVLRNDGLMRLLLPAVRSEIRLAELWRDWHAAGLDAPITALYGQEDTTEEGRGMAGWTTFSTRGFELVSIPGGHFPAPSSLPHLTEVINSRLAAVTDEKVSHTSGGTGNPSQHQCDGPAVS